MSKQVNQGSVSMYNECDCGKSYSGSERGAKFWYKLHGKVCIQARRPLPLYNMTINDIDVSKVKKNVSGATANKTLEIIKTQCVNK